MQGKDLIAQKAAVAVTICSVFTCLDHSIASGKAESSVCIIYCQCFMKDHNDTIYSLHNATSIGAKTPFVCVKQMLNTSCSYLLFRNIQKRGKKNVSAMTANTALTGILLFWMQRAMRHFKCSPYITFTFKCHVSSGQLLLVVFTAPCKFPHWGTKKGISYLYIRLKASKNYK